jgi:hypothetical protein
MSRYRYEPLGNESNIRLITLLPGNPSDDITVELYESSFEKDSQLIYDALSYVWGSESDPGQVHIGQEGPTPVTKNLLSALKHLRHESEARTLWIDALSIDQSNNTEKSAQVSMMGEIYRRASRVIAWLGPEENGSGRVLTFMNYIGSQIQIDWRTKLVRAAPACTDPDVADAAKDLKLDREDVFALGHLLARPWFERLWIRQEVILGNPKTIVQCGSQHILLKEFRSALICLYQKSSPFYLISPELFDRLEYLRGFIWQGATVSLWDLREEFGKAKCRDPRDRIYAIASMLYPAERAVIPQPDYNVPFRDVYRDVVLRWLSTFSGLDLLRECELQDGDTGPSWVPDWSRGATASLRSHPLLASSQLGSWYENPEPGILSVAGASCATVTEAGTILNDDHLTLKDLYHQVHEFLAPQILDGQYVSGCSLVEAYARTLVCDGIADEKDPAGNVWPDLETAKLAIQRIHSESQISDRDFGRSAPGNLALRCMLPISGKKFIKCDKGYIGIAPPLTQPGDQVCVLLGCKAPMILRPMEDGSFILVGESFVHGLSKGEGLLGPLPENIRIAKVIQNAQVGYALGFVNELSDTVSFVDPRLASMSLDLEEFTRMSNENGNGQLILSPEVLREKGVDIKYFNLR